jgi:hypothetical protein
VNQSLLISLPFFVANSSCNRIEVFYELFSRSDFRSGRTFYRDRLGGDSPFCVRFFSQRQKKIAHVSNLFPAPIDQYPTM